MANNKKLKDKLKQEWGKAKSGYFSFDLIKEYHASKTATPNYYTLSDRVVQDLDIHDFFKLADRTCSAIGQQYLFDQMINTHSDAIPLESLENQIEFYTKEESQRLETQYILSQLSTSNDYYFPFLMFGDLPPKMNQFKIVKIVQLFIFAGIAIALFYPAFWLPLLIIFGFNAILHYWHKNKIGNFSEIFSRLTRLTTTAQQLLAHSHLSFEEKSEYSNTIKKINKITSKVFLLKMDALKENEFTSIIWYFIELIKILTLTEITTFHSLVDDIENSRKEIHQLFTFIGKIDQAISIASFRESLPHYSIPNFTSPQKAIHLEGLYHPLVEKCVKNNFQIKDKSLLLTGSNMSGKSTFIKAVNLNTIAAQTLNTSFTKNSSTPFFAIATSIRISDDIQEEKSYYMEEVFSIKSLMELSKNTEEQFLFTIDEVFKGTNTIERISAAKAILEYLNKHNHLVLVSTHDIELTQLLQEKFDLYYFQESVEGGQLSFDYTIKKGALKKKNAIKILEIADYPPEVIKEAQRLANQFEEEKIKSRNIK